MLLVLQYIDLLIFNSDQTRMTTSVSTLKGLSLDVGKQGCYSRHCTFKDTVLWSRKH